MLFIISGPSSCGKSSLCAALANTDSTLTRLIPHTTRPPRGLERTGEEYFFDSAYDFCEADVLESSKHGNFVYWTDKSELDSLLAAGADVLCCVEPSIGVQLKRLYPDSVTIFIRASIATLKERLMLRHSDNIEARMESVKQDLLTGRVHYDYVLINEDFDFDTTLDELKCLVNYLREGKGLKIDLHTHTTASDGFLSTQELIDEAKKAGISYLAITDHDHITSTKELQKQNRDICLIPGVEATCSFTGSSGKTYQVHVVGLGVDEESPELNRLLELNRKEDKRPYITAILEKLCECGIDLGSYEDICTKYPNTTQVGQIHIAKQLIEHGAVDDIDQAFLDYLGPSGKAYVRNEQFCIPMSFMLHNILKAGGIPVLAHPFLYDMGEEDFMDLLISFRHLSEERGAIEAFYPSHTEQQTKHLLEIISRLGLVPSAGSDYHSTGFDTLNAYPARICEKLLWRLGVKV
ncbi:MAG: PHP domain-containing protein [Eggerthellaceae bacterium]|nr:PHP domain-containing protein [Eggerthellaceae bacterium]